MNKMDGWELQPVGTTAVPETPLVVQLELTSKCNLRCMHCYNDSGSATNRTRMNKSDWFSLAEQLNSVPIDTVVISGGEPFLEKRTVIELVRRLKDVAEIQIITNGTYVDDEILRQLRREHEAIGIQISIDGSVPAIHDEIRGSIGSWNSAISAARLAIEEGFPVKIAHTLVKKNVDEVSGMFLLAMMLRPFELAIGFGLPLGRGATSISTLLTRTERVSARQQIEDLITKFDKHIKYSITAELDHSALRTLAMSLPTGFVVRDNGDVLYDCLFPISVSSALNEATIIDHWSSIVQLYVSGRLSTILDTKFEDRYGLVFGEVEYGF